MFGKGGSIVYRLLAESGNSRLLEADLNLAQRFELAMRGTVEIIQRSELEKLLEEKKNPRAYWGFECSGKRAHPARNDAHRPRARLRFQGPRLDPIRLPFHSLPRRLALDDQQQIRRRPREDQNSESHNHPTGLESHTDNGTGHAIERERRCYHFLSLYASRGYIPDEIGSCMCRDRSA